MHLSLKIIDSFFLFTKIPYILPWKNSLGKFCGLYYVRVQTWQAFVIILILWINQKVKKLSSWKSTGTNSFSFAGNCITCYGWQLLKSSPNWFKTAIFFHEDKQLEERILVSKPDSMEKCIHEPLWTSLPHSRLRLQQPILYCEH